MRHDQSINRCRFLQLTARRWTAGLMIAEAVTVPVVILGAAIGFPGILIS